MTRAAGAELRRVRPEDLSDLVPLIAAHAAFERGEATASLAQLGAALFGATPRLFGWVAADATRLLGYATASREFSTWRGCEFLHMDCLFVREGARDQRLGARLLAAVRDFARDQGLPEVQWQTPAWNEDAARFYRRSGAGCVEKLRFRLACD